jgi:hypothetical protein
MRQENIWYHVSEKLPETDQQHRNYYESEEVLLFLGDCFTTDRYFYDSEKNISGWSNPENDEVVEQWCYIRWPTVEDRERKLEKILDVK